MVPVPVDGTARMIYDMANIWSGLASGKNVNGGEGEMHELQFCFLVGVRFALSERPVE